MSSIKKKLSIFPASFQFYVYLADIQVNFFNIKTKMLNAF